MNKSYTISLEGRKFSCHDHESLLDAMIRLGIPVRFSCKKGICKTCKLEKVKGLISENARKPFKKKNQPYFLPCIEYPHDHLEIKYPKGYNYASFNGESEYELQEESNDDKPGPDLELLGRLEKDDLLNKVLKSFYDDVYNDDLLRPYFKSVSKDWVIQKQYAFLYMLFSGKEIYMGERTRNAHHWMVISDELFDYREDLIEKHMIKHGLELKFRKRWRDYHEFFRSRMVKSRPWKKIWDNHHYPLEGIEEFLVETGAICDACTKEIEAGSHAKYHVRLGEVYCNACS